MFYVALITYLLFVIVGLIAVLGGFDIIKDILEYSRIGEIIVKVINFVFKLFVSASQFVFVSLLVFLVGTSLLTWHTNTIINSTKDENVQLQSMLCNVVEPYAIEAAQKGTLVEKINTMPDLIEFVNGSESLCNEDNVLETIERYLKNCDYINDLESEKKLYTSIRQRILN